jgi:RNA polymerase sigma factor (sigma-70 family)
VRASQPVVAVRDASNEYRKLVAALALRAMRMGSRDAEGASQEALKRSLANPVSRAALDYYFQEHPPAGLRAPDWPLEQLFAWLHGVLRFVVREESARASSRREVRPLDDGALDVRDPSPDQLDVLIDDEQQTIVRECLSTLGEDYRRVLTLRAKGVKYSEIASRLGVSENTVATWVRRGTRAVAQQVRERMDLRLRVGTVPEHRK